MKPSSTKAALVMAVMFSTSASAEKLGDVVNFRCEIPERPDSLERARSEPGHARMDGDRLILPKAQMPNPELIVTVRKDALASEGNSKIQKRQDLTALYERQNLFKRAKRFRLSGSWPGSFSLIGSTSDAELGKISIGTIANDNSAMPVVAQVEFTPSGAGAMTGVCSVAYMTPMRR